MPTTPPLRLVPHDERPPQQAESPAQHCRNCLQLVRLALETCPPFHTDLGEAVAVPVHAFAAIQARLEAAIALLEEARP